MRNFVFLIITILLNAGLHAQSHAFTMLMEKYSDDTALTMRLNEFAQGGIELPLNMGGVSANQLIDTARSYLGTPHCMGGLTHRCIDCSGLLYVTFKSMGIDVPHSSEGIARYGKLVVDVDSLIPGDLVFFVGTYNTSKLITHSGIYLGNYQFIHTSASRGVIISELRSAYYKKHFIFGKRIFEQD